MPNGRIAATLNETAIAGDAEATVRIYQQVDVPQRDTVGAAVPRTRR